MDDSLLLLVVSFAAKAVLEKVRTVLCERYHEIMTGEIEAALGHLTAREREEGVADAVSASPLLLLWGRDKGGSEATVIVHIEGSLLKGDLILLTIL